MGRVSFVTESKSEILNANDGSGGEFMIRDEECIEEWWMEG